MSLTKARELREQRAKMIAEANQILEKKDLTQEDRAKFDAIHADAEVLKADIDRLEKAAEAESELRTAAPPRENVAGAGDDTGADAAIREKHFREVWSRAMKYDGPAEYGFKGISAADRATLREARDGMTTGGGNALQGSGGGYFVPVGFVREVEDALKYYGPMLNVATIMETATGQPLPFPTDNDTTVSGALVAESSQVSEGDVTLGSVVFGAYKYSTNMVKVSIELLQDSAFDLDTFLKEKFATRIGRILNTHFTTGTGSDQPNGIITAATAGPTATGSATNDGGDETGATSIGSDDLIELEHSIDPLYRRGACYMANDATIKTIKKLKDKYGRPLWLPGLATNTPDTINGYPYAVNNDMATIAASAKSVAFGQLKKYTIRRVRDLSVLRLVERFADYGQVAFVGFARYDGDLLDAGTHPVKYLVQAAS